MAASVHGYRLELMRVPTQRLTRSTRELSPGHYTFSLVFRYRGAKPASFDVVVGGWRESVDVPPNRARWRVDIDWPEYPDEITVESSDLPFLIETGELELDLRESRLHLPEN